MSLIPVQKHRIRGLDSIRFLCALAVFFGHGGLPGTRDLFAEYHLINLVWRAFSRILWLSAPEAVIIFFVISGFCIHYPFAGSNEQPKLAEFYTRRLLRLLLPVLVAIPLSALIGVHLTLFQFSILWSLLAELIYYLLYPWLRRAQLRIGSWTGIILVAYLGAYLVVITRPHTIDYPTFGSALNWLVGIPCWLLGCQLAEACQAAPERDISAFSVWGARALILSATLLCGGLSSYTPVGLPWTLDLFAVPAAWWLQREIAYRRHAPPPRALEWAGLWSYSLYLLHMPAMVLFTSLFPSLPDYPLGWLIRIAFVLFTCYLFYRVVEYPSHLAAKKASRKVKALLQGKATAPVA